MSTPVGVNGRLPPGESWRRALGEVAKKFADGAKRRYRIRGRQIEPGWWAYEVSKEPKPRYVPKFIRATTLTELAEGLPRCAQRATERHGGGTKVAWPNRAYAERAVELAGKGRAYPCDLPAPAIGKHWHHTTTAKRRKR